MYLNLLGLDESMARPVLAPKTENEMTTELLVGSSIAFSILALLFLLGIAVLRRVIAVLDRAVSMLLGLAVVALCATIAAWLL